MFGYFPSSSVPRIVRAGNAWARSPAKGIRVETHRWVTYPSLFSSETIVEDVSVNRGHPEEDDKDSSLPRGSPRDQFFSTHRYHQDGFF